MKKVYVIAIIFVLVLLMIQFPDLMLSPGELLSDHQKLNDKCMDCHDPFYGISSDKCIACHKPEEIENGMRNDSSNIRFHTKLTSLECVACHTEHKGVHPLTTTTGFDHTMLSLNERNRCNNCHSSQTDTLHSMLSGNCESCHNTTSWTTTVSFRHDLIIGEDPASCISCHNTPADAFHSSVKDNCSECHGTDKWIPSTFDHTAYFVLDQNHQTTCATCHTNNNFKVYTCYGCHEHSASNIREEHLEEGITNFTNCTSCHHSGNENEGQHDGSNDRGNGSNEADQIQKYLDRNGDQNTEQKDDD